MHLFPTAKITRSGLLTKVYDIQRETSLIFLQLAIFHILGTKFKTLHYTGKSRNIFFSFFYEESCHCVILDIKQKKVLPSYMHVRKMYIMQQNQGAMFAGFARMMRMNCLKFRRTRSIYQPKTKATTT